MFTNTGYALDGDREVECQGPGFAVESCGHYRLLRQPRMVTERINGRRDYQLVYVAAGAGNFWNGSRVEKVEAGHLVVYRPYERQHMEYLLEENPDIYWLHFSGMEAEELLQQLEMQHTVLPVGCRHEYNLLLDSVIHELQAKLPHYRQIVNGLGRQLMAEFARGMPQWQAENARQSKEILLMAAMMEKQYDLPISVEESARKCGMSVSGFIKSFKKQTGEPPNQYLIEVRMRKAAELLKNTDWTVAEIALQVGYENQLYFSRLFKSKTGQSPSGFRAGAQA